MVSTIAKVKFKCLFFFLIGKPSFPRTVRTGNTKVLVPGNAFQSSLVFEQGILGKYHCTVDLLFDWLGLVCFANKNKNCQLSYRWFQTSQTGGQWCSDTSAFSIPCLNPRARVFARGNHFQPNCRSLSERSSLV
jgi:hypothetical protein